MYRYGPTKCMNGHIGYVTLRQTSVTRDDTIPMNGMRKVNAIFPRLICYACQWLMNTDSF